MRVATRLPVPDGILEIGYVAFFKRTVPSRTTFVAVEHEPGEEALADAVMLPGRPDVLPALLASGRFAVVILRVNHHPGPLLRRVVDLLCVAELAMPLAILDFEDEAFIHAALHPLLPRAARIFKRELPVDRWRLLQPGAGEARDEAGWRGDPAAQRILEAIMPLALGLPLHPRRFLLPADPVPKTADIFFAGRVEGSAWLRRHGMAELLALRDRGVVVDIPAQPLPPLEFYRRCAAAVLTWSPQGYGWDCFRHYEAAACRSVPVINYPTIERDGGLVEGLHALFHDPAPGGLTAAVLAAVADKPRLLRMGEAARDHVLRLHRPEAIGDRVLSRVVPHLGHAPGLLLLMPHLTFGGMERLASLILAHLAGLGYRVHVLVLSHKPGEADAGADWFAAHASSLVRLALEGDALAERIAATVDEVGAVAAAVIGLSPAFGALPGLRERQPDLRVTSFQFNEHELCDQHRACAAMLDLLVVEGEVVARTLANLGVAENRIAVIPSGPDLAPARAARGGGENGRVRPAVVFAGRMDRIKAGLDFVEICGRLRDRAVDFVMAGDGHLAGTMRERIAELGLDARIAWLGRLPHAEMGALFRRADIVVVPSHIDGRPMVVQEAQAYGVAVVASRVGAIPELVTDGHTGLLCRPHDIDGFAAAVSRLLDDPALRRELGEAGRARVFAAGGLAASLDAYTAAILGPHAPQGR